jgi:hypothetical protein
MRAVLLALIAIAMVTAAAACGSSGNTTTSGPAPPNTFASQRYGFRVTLPSGTWSVQDAQADWDGKHVPGLDDPVGANVMDVATGRELVVVSAPTRMGLAGFRAAMQAAEVPHSCSASSSAAQTSLGGEPALGWTATCVDGYDLNNLAALHGTHGYMIFLASPRPSNLPEDRSVIESIRQSFRFTH